MLTLPTAKIWIDLLATYTNLNSSLTYKVERFEIITIKYWSINLSPFAT